MMHLSVLRPRMEGHWADPREFDILRQAAVKFPEAKQISPSRVTFSLKVK